MSVLKVRDNDGNIIDIPALKGEDGTSVEHAWSGTVLTITSKNGTSSMDLKGESGVYVGPGDMPEGYNVQVDPNGEILTSPVTSVNGETGDVMLDIPDVSNFATTTYVDDKVDNLEIPSVDGLASEDFVIEKINEAQLDNGDTNIDLSIYPTKDEVDTKITNYLGSGAVQIAFAADDTEGLNYIGTIGNGTDKLPNDSIIVVHPVSSPSSDGKITLTINGYGPYPIYQKVSLGMGPMRLRPISRGHFLPMYRSLVLRLSNGYMWIAEDISLPNSQDYNAPGGFLTKELLWSNASPTSSFNAQTITCNANYDLSQLAGVIVTAENNISLDLVTEEQIQNTTWFNPSTNATSIESSSELNCLFLLGSEMYSRGYSITVSKISDFSTQIQCSFEAGMLQPMNNMSIDSSNDVCVPVKIYGLFAIKEAQGGSLFV